MKETMISKALKHIYVSRNGLNVDELAIRCKISKIYAKELIKSLRKKKLIVGKRDSEVWRGLVKAFKRYSINPRNKEKAKYWYENY